LELSVTTITFDDTTRTRKDLDEEKLLELIESFKNVGQITPIVVERDGKLVAGRRRLEAARRLGWPTIRAEYRDSLSEIDRKIVEFDENDKRSQLTWQESAAAIKEIHELKKAEAVAAYTNWTAADTAKILGVSEGKVSEDLVLASSLSNERVANRPSRRGALDTLKRERELVLVRELARRRAENLGLVLDSNATSLTGGVVYNADCRDILKTMEPDSVDLIFMDPPWAIDFEHSSQWTSKWVASYDDTVGHVRPMLLEVFPLLFKVMKPASHFYCFFPAQELEWWITQLTKVGFHVRQRPLIWFKTGQPSISDPYSTFLSTYETFIWGAKPDPDGVRRLLSRATPEGLGISRQPGLWHENEKPVELVETYIEASSVVNEIVFDPFSGGGSTLVAAFNTGRYFIGVEGDPGNYEKIRRRLTELETSKEVIEE